MENNDIEIKGKKKGIKVFFYKNRTILKGKFFRNEEQLKKDSAKINKFADEYIKEISSDPRNIGRIFKKKVYVATLYSFVCCEIIPYKK